MNLRKIFAFLLSCNAMGLSASEKLIGKQAPVFLGQAIFPDGSQRTLNLHDYRGKDIVLYFYPMDNSPYCTLQAQSFKENFKKFEMRDIVLIGISPDSLKSHTHFCSILNLPYPLVADTYPKYAIAKQYKARGFLFGKRKTFLIDKNGIIFKTFDQVDIENQIDNILQAFDAHNR